MVPSYPKWLSAESLVPIRLNMSGMIGINDSCVHGFLPKEPSVAAPPRLGPIVAQTVKPSFRVKKEVMAMAKQNCWEFRKCGREPGGFKVNELGTCPAATEKRTDGINGGKNGGRACWAITGTLCGGKTQGTFANKVGNCLKCEFYQTVGAEEGPNQEGAKDILAKLT